MRTKYVQAAEEKILRSVNVHDMTDEEDGDEPGSFKRKSPKDRSPEIQDLIRKLDYRHEEKLKQEERNIAKVKRVVADSPVKLS